MEIVYLIAVVLAIVQFIAFMQLFGIRKYLKQLNGFAVGAVCPFCGDTDNLSHDINGGTVECAKCGRKWQTMIKLFGKTQGA